MRNIYLIALNTLRELLRNRLLYSLLFFALFLMLIMVALGQLSFTEQFRLTLGLGLSSIHICLVALTLFVGGSIVYREIDRLTILTLLARPVSRTQFLLGKYFGFLLLMFIFTVGFYILFILNMLIMGYDFSFADFIIVFWGMFLEVSLILSFTIFFSTFSETFMAILFSICLFLIGHWASNLMQIVKNSSDSQFKIVIEFVCMFFPNLNHYNWRLYPLEHNLDIMMISKSSLEALMWSCFFLVLSSLIFRRRDFA